MSICEAIIFDRIFRPSSTTAAAVSSQDVSIPSSFMAATIALMKSFKQELPDQEWDDRQRSRSAHMLQGRPWAQFQSALGRQVVVAEGDGWSWLGVIMKGRGGSYLYTPYGPTARSART